MIPKASTNTERIGIYAGTFDPVHSGHISFALQALQAANLDMVYFLPERRPRAKQNVEHFAHRVAMLNKATLPHPRLKVVELVDVSFSVERTLPYLQKRFPEAKLVFMFGSDIVPGLDKWRHVSKLLKQNELVIGLRHGDKSKDIHRIVESWPTKPPAITMFPSYAPRVSSGRIRQALRLGRPAEAEGVLSSVERYSNQHWLYVSLASS